MSSNIYDSNTGKLSPFAGVPIDLLTSKMSKDGDSKDNVTTFTSSDTTDANADSWTSVTQLATNETHSSIFAKMSQMFKNVRYLYKMLGTTDISSIGNGTVTGGINTLNSALTQPPVKKQWFTLSGWANLTPGTVKTVERASITIPNGYEIFAVEYMSGSPVYMNAYSIDATNNKITLGLVNTTNSTYTLNNTDGINVIYRKVYS